MSAHPPWLVVAVSGVILALAFMLLGKLMRAVGLLLFVALAAAGVWYGWQRFHGNDPLVDSQPQPILRQSDPGGLTGETPSGQP